MKFKDYLEGTRRTWNKKENVLDNINHAMLGLIDESGEIAKAYKAGIAYDENVNKMNVAEEIGDMLYFFARIIDELDFEKRKELEDGLDKLATDKPKFDGNPSELDLVLAINTRVSGVYAALCTNEGPMVARALNDLMYNIKIFTDMLETTPQKLMEANLAKLKERYPEDFSNEKAVNRDLESEAKTVEKNVGHIKQ